MLGKNTKQPKTQREKTQLGLLYRTKKHDHGTIRVAVASERLPSLRIEFIGRVFAISPDEQIRMPGALCDSDELDLIGKGTERHRT